MSSLLPPNASKTERALEAATARLDAVPVPLRTLWNPDEIRLDMLPWLAWGLSIDSWKSYWPEHVQRARVRAAIDIQRRKGTAESVRAVVASFGGAVEIREWWQMQPRGLPHTFELLLTISGQPDGSNSAQFVADIIGEVDRTKPVRSHFTFTQGLQATQEMGVTAGVRIATYRRLELTAINPEDPT